MKKLALLAVLNFYFISTAYGYVRVGSEKYLSPNNTIEKAQNEGFGITYKEIQVKKDIHTLKNKNKKIYNEVIQDKDANSEHYQSYLLELKEGLPKVEKAKILAKYTLFKALKKYESDLQNSILNRHATEDTKAFEYYVKRDLNEKTYFNPRLRKSENKNDYTFETSDWGRVTISANLKKAEWQIDVASHLDNNKLDPRAKDIIIDKESGELEFEVQPEEPIMAPPLAGGEKKSKVIPKFRPPGKQ